MFIVFGAMLWTSYTAPKPLRALAAYRDHIKHQPGGRMTTSSAGSFEMPRDPRSGVLDLARAGSNMAERLSEGGSTF